MKTPPTRRHALAVLGLASLLSAVPPMALGQAGHGAHGHSASAPEARESDFVDAEVRRVDTARQRVTLRHAAVPALDMGPMTMVFAVAEPAWLQTLKTGDKVQVRISQRGSSYTVTALRPAP
jgi:Cu(I)/Ag(I) efflux system protein CusF